MKIVAKLILSLFLGMTLFACSDTRGLQKMVTKYPQPLGYMFESAIDSLPKKDSVIIQFKGYDFSYTTKVKKTNSLILPFVVLNYWQYKYSFKLGSNLFSQNYNQFFFDALLDESDRSGRFALCYDSARNQDVYTLEVSLDTCITTSAFSESQFIFYFFYDYATIYTEGGKPSNSLLKCNLTLRKGDRVLMTKPVISSFEMPFYTRGNESSNELMQLMAGTMVESLNQCTRLCIEQIVKEVNAAIQH